MEETKKEFTPRPERAERPQRGRRRRKVCAFCVDKVAHVDYKDAGKLKKYMSERGKILPRRMTGTCAAHQRQLTEAIKQIQRKPVSGHAFRDDSGELPGALGQN